jgi:hypothetical protein
MKPVAKLKTSRPKGAESVVFVYCSPRQKEALEAAADKQAQMAGPDAKIATYKWLLRQGLEAAKKLGIKVPEE